MADIDEEVTRLNRIVAEVLDFARPIKFDARPSTSTPSARMRFGRCGANGPARRGPPRPRPCAGSIVTDGERVRLALVNILTNAAACGAGARETADRTDRAIRLDHARYRFRTCERSKSATGASGSPPTTWRGSSIRSSPRVGPGPASDSRFHAVSSKDLAAPLRSRAVRAMVPTSGSNCRSPRRTLQNLERTL